MCVQAFVVVGDHNGHIGLGVKCAKEVSKAASRLRVYLHVSLRLRGRVARPCCPWPRKAGLLPDPGRCPVAGALDASGACGRCMHAARCDPAACCTGGSAVRLGIYICCRLLAWSCAWHCRMPRVPPAAGRALGAVLRGLRVLTTMRAHRRSCPVRCVQVATAIRGAIIQAKMSVVPVRRGYWGNKIGKVHTVPTKVHGKCGSVTIRLTPAPRGAGIVAARTPKKVLQMAGIEDCYTSSRGSTKTLGNFVRATFAALAKTYGFLTPDLWRESKYTKAPFQEFTDFLAKPYLGDAKPAYDAGY